MSPCLLPFSPPSCTFRRRGPGSSTGALIDRLQAGLQRAAGVILISAPAGFGKTTHNGNVYALYSFSWCLLWSCRNRRAPK